MRKQPDRACRTSVSWSTMTSMASTGDTAAIRSSSALRSTRGVPGGRPARSMAGTLSRRRRKCPARRAPPRSTAAPGAPTGTETGTRTPICAVRVYVLHRSVQSGSRKAHGPRRMHSGAGIRGLTPRTGRMAVRRFSGGTVTVTGIITAIIVGAIIGALGRLVVPGRQPIPIWLTIVVGIIAAFVGTLLARAIGIPTVTSGIDWLELLVQVIVAAVFVVIAANLYTRRGVRR